MDMIILCGLVLWLFAFAIWFHRFANRYLKFRAAALRLYAAHLELQADCPKEYFEALGTAVLDELKGQPDALARERVSIIAEMSRMSNNGEAS